MRISPYVRLIGSAREWVRRVVARRVVRMFCYAKADVRNGSSFQLADLAERIRAAHQLGWECRIRWKDDEGLVVEYVEKLPDTPEWY